MLVAESTLLPRTQLGQLSEIAGAWSRGEIDDEEFADQALPYGMYLLGILLQYGADPRGWAIAVLDFCNQQKAQGWNGQ